MLMMPDFFNATLLEKLEDDGLTLSIDVSKADELYNLLSDFDHTYLFLTQGSRYEFVRATRPSANSGLVPISRGSFGTGIFSFPVGSCVDVRLSASIVKEIVEDAMPTCLPDCESTLPPFDPPVTIEPTTTIATTTTKALPTTKAPPVTTAP